MDKSLIAEAFAKAQAKFKQPELNREAKILTKSGGSYTIPYADLNECIECVREALTENGLSFTQTTKHRVIQVGDKFSIYFYLILTLYHSGGESMESVLPLTLSEDPQKIGSQMTYLKRYQLSAFFGLAADFDDDGNAAVGNHYNDLKKNKKGSSPQSPQSNPQPKKTSAAPQEFVMTFGSDGVKGKKLGDLSDDQLAKIVEWSIAEQTKPNAKKANLANIEANARAVLKARPKKPLDKAVDDLMNEQSLDDYVIPKTITSLSELHDKPLKKITEAELRQALKILNDDMKSAPKDGSVSKIMEVRGNIVSFLKSMGVEL